MRLGMLSTSLSHCCWVTLCHSWCKNPNSSALFDGLWPSTFLLITFRSFQWGSGLEIGLVLTGPWSGGPPSTPWLTWLCGMEHCPAGKNNPQSWRTLSEQKENKFSSRITLYLAWFMCHSQRHICQIPALLKHPQTITAPPPNFTVGARHCGL